MKVKRRTIAGVGIIGLAAAGVAFGIYTAPEPPLDEMKIALERLSEAKKAEAQVYAHDAYKAAEQAYDSAMVCWAEENKRLFLFRDYTELNRWISVTIEKAAEAEQLSGKRSKSAGNKLQQGISILEKKIEIYNRFYKRLPLPSSVTKAHHKGSIKLSEAKFAWENKRFGEAEKSFQQAKELINASSNKAEKLLTSWFSGHNAWQKLAKAAIAQSANGKKVIVVDKLAHTCTVYQNKKAIRTFDAELGVNWMGDKKSKGDKATPEGNYKITQKKSGGNTKFHKALLINYPNDEDRQRFQQNKKAGIIPSKADIGGLIEIHGLGGKGVDWTDGCVALRNDEMDALYQLVAVGTPVVIVGSIRSLNEVTGKNVAE
ncbi:L,D-transpeptidase [Maribellus sp. YY47]|uniref:L,D-transpeptidase family protein n=1 Tax=Maribellus sp. YY47 TaxID=2929486 RepID=UPI0020013B5C|nr:L,D-transpeptidase [Maribellus sp. YY47]MCK3683321.1 L,D-transpeptidase [Maribellus sp. YY47]